MTKLPPRSTPEPSDQPPHEPSTVEPVIWSRSQASFAPLMDPRDSTHGFIATRDCQTAPDAIETTLAPLPTSDASVADVTNSIYDRGEAADSELDVETVSVPSKPPSFITRLKTRIDESLPDDVSKARKPFLTGMLAGIVLMLLLGQVFRATQPEPGYAAATPVDYNAGRDAPVAFIDKVPDVSPQ